MKQILTIALLFIAGFSFSQDDKCYDKFKTGTFIVYSNGKPIPDYKIIRKRNKQIEIYNKGKSKMISKITWVNSYTYVLSESKHINVGEGCLSEEDEVTFVIEKCEGKFYTVTWEQSGCGSGFTTLKKVK